LLPDHEKAAEVTAADLMTSPPITIGPDEPVADAARLMRDRRIKRLPVTNTTGHLIGVLSRADVLSVFLRPEGTIRHEVIEEVIRSGFPGTGGWPLADLRRLLYRGE
jgi:predicted transcriptional regulator